MTGVDEVPSRSVILAKEFTEAQTAAQAIREELRILTARYEQARARERAARAAISRQERIERMAARAESRRRARPPVPGKKENPS